MAQALPRATEHAGWLLVPTLTGDLHGRGALADLTALLQADPQLSWGTALPLFRSGASLYASRAVGVPASAGLMTLFFRRDVLQAAAAQGRLPGALPPATWEDLVSAAAALNGSASLGGGSGSTGPAYGACFPRPPAGCSQAHVLLAAAAPALQARGTAQGLLFEPSTLAPLLGSAAFGQALRTLAELRLLSPPPRAASEAPASKPSWISWRAGAR